MSLVDVWIWWTNWMSIEGDWCCLAEDDELDIL